MLAKHVGQHAWLRLSSDGSHPRSGTYPCLNAAIRCFQGVRSTDERDVRQRLGEIAHKALVLDVVFLGKQSEVVAQREQAFEQFCRVVFSADQSQVGHHPERAGQECALVASQAVFTTAGVVPEDKTVPGQVFFDRLDGTDDARIVRGKKSDDGQQEVGRHRDPRCQKTG